MPMIDSKNITVKQAKCMGLHGFFEKNLRLNIFLMCGLRAFTVFLSDFNNYVSRVVYKILIVHQTLPTEM